jgi:esterase/lipase superfamily enzyme
MPPTVLTSPPRRAAAIAGAGRLAALALAAALLSGCGTRGELAIVDPAAAAGATSVPVIVATARAAAPAPDFFSGERDFTTSFARFDVSIPPDRKPGTIRYPRGTPDPSRDFVLTAARGLAGQRDFVAEVNAAAARLPRAERRGVLFVHGFNTNFAEGLMKEAQLRHDLEVPGVGVLFTWPSRAKLLAYVADRESALFSRDSLAETIRLMGRTRLDQYDLVAHSMGTFLAMETLHTMALSGERAALSRIGAVVLISADLEIDLFRKQAPPVLAAGVPIYLVVSDDDKVLRLSSFLRGERDRLGSIRSTAELGGLDVSVVDVSAIDSDDATGHLKVGTSPELIAFIQRIRRSGVAIFEDDQKVGLLDQGAVLVQGATGIVLRPIAR